MDEKENKYLGSPNTTWRLFFVLMMYKKTIIHCVIFSTVITLIVTLLMPNWYESTASVFPIDQPRLLGTLGNVSSSLRTFSRFRNSAYGKYFSKAIGTIETDRCVTILKSNKVLLSVIQKFDLVHVYDIKSYPIENTIKELLKNTEFKVVLEGNIFIKVYDKDRQRAADMANYFVEILNKTNSEIIAESVQGNKQFINTQYMSNLYNLANTEDSLKRIQKRSGIISLPEQTKAYINTTAELAQELITSEVRANVLKKTLSTNHPYVRAADLEIEELKKKLNEFSVGTTVSENESNIFSPLSSNPAFSIEYSRRYRDVETQYKILDNITSLYEQAKVEGQWNTPAVVVLDRAIPAERKTRPQRILIVFGGLAIGFLSSIIFCTFINSWNDGKKQNNVFYKLLSDLMNKIRADFASLRLHSHQMKSI
ncbi:MAG: Wzz/FepE/Etk N-terminal domain-containing protein [Bacteroidota bacterium]